MARPRRRRTVTRTGPPRRMRRPRPNAPRCPRSSATSPTPTRRCRPTRPGCAGSSPRTAPGYLDDRPNAPAVETTADLDEMIARGRVAAAGWRELGAAGRAEILHRAADIFAARRGEFLAVAA